MWSPSVPHSPLSRVPCPTQSSVLLSAIREFRSTYKCWTVNVDVTKLSRDSSKAKRTQWIVNVFNARKAIYRQGLTLADFFFQVPTSRLVYNEYINVPRRSCLCLVSWERFLFHHVFLVGVGYSAAQHQICLTRNSTKIIRDHRAT